MVKAETQQKELVDIESDAIKQRISAYGVLLRNNDVLMVKTHSDSWEMPGGTPEPGETLKQGLKRELEEEVNLRAKVGPLFYVRESYYHSPSGKSYHSFQFYFFIEAASTPLAAGTETCSFVPLHQLTPQNTNNSTYLALQHINHDGLAYDLWD